MTQITLERPSIHVDFSWSPAHISVRDFDALCASHSTLVLAGYLLRPGVCLFFNQLEYEYFPPVGPVNDSFQMVQLDWPLKMGKDSQKWAMAALPMKYRPLAEDVAKRAGLRFNNGFPRIIEDTRMVFCGAAREGRWREIQKQFPNSAKVHRFNYEGDNLFTLESEDKSTYYENSPKTTLEMRKIELMQIEGIEQEFREKYAAYFAAKKGAK